MSKTEAMDFSKIKAVITIDGPAASGKSSVSRELAKRFGWHWVSTGAFYRGLGYVAQQLKVNLDDEKALLELAHSNVWSVEMGEDKTLVMFQGKDVTALIHNEAVGSIASKISQIPSVRDGLLQPQRDCLARVPSVLIAEGRDCGTVVFPDAEVKVFLTASGESRAERRAKELGVDKEDTIKAQQKRDYQDSNRKSAPMKVPENALVLDTSEMDFDEVVGEVEKRLRKALVDKS